MAWGNYEDVVGQMVAAGLAVEQLEFGRMQRCRVDGERGRPGWYILHELQSSGQDVLIVGSFGVWRGADNGAQKIQVKKTEMTAEQRASLRKRLSEDRRRAAKARQREQDRAAASAAKAWAKCEPTGESEYLARKGVGAHGLRFSPSGAVVIPMLDTVGKIHGLQVIRAPSAKRKLAKEFWPAGLAMAGHFHLIGAPGRILLITEGYATAASLHEATGLPVAVAFTANNLAPVSAALHKRYKQARILICADDDRFGKCRSCKTRIALAQHLHNCPECDEQHQIGNAGVTNASAVALEVNGAWARPRFADEEQQTADFLKSGHKFTDYNDLHAREGLHVVRTQLEARLGELGWDRQPAKAPGASANKGGGDTPLRPIETIDELIERFSLVYGMGGMVFDHDEHCLLSTSDMRDACISRQTHRAWAEHPDRSIVRSRNVGFDPSDTDSNITCNLWAGWETTPQAGKCDRLLELLEYMCSADPDSAILYEWVLSWIAYPIQHPGAKMKTTLVIHGPQGTGKNMFFEALMSIYGNYGRVIDQNSLEDKFNDWASHKLFLVADEVIARSDLYHVKNKLKAFITGEWIRINPKGMQAYDERNHANIVFLSNESMPVVLEEDDRRHAVIWTPPELGREFYREVKHEIDNGGVAALHHHLLHHDMGDFSSATRPPQSSAKAELINLGLDSTSRFYYELAHGELGEISARPALSADVYDLYKTWCKRIGTPATSMPKLINAFNRKHSIKAVRKRYVDGAGMKGPHSIMWLDQNAEPSPDVSEGRWLGDHIESFRYSVRDYQGASNA